MIGSFNDICRELYEAREHLRNPRARTDLDCVTNVTQTWERYLADVGLQRELYEAREQLSHWGGDKSKLTSGNLILEVGISRM